VDLVDMVALAVPAMGMARIRTELLPLLQTKVGSKFETKHHRRSWI
jgi:hypothetical protein